MAGLRVRRTWWIAQRIAPEAPLFRELSHRCVGMAPRVAAVLEGGYELETYLSGSPTLMVLPLHPPPHPVGPAPLPGMPGGIHPPPPPRFLAEEVFTC